MDEHLSTQLTLFDACHLTCNNSDIELNLPEI